MLSAKRVGRRRGVHRACVVQPIEDPRTCVWCAGEPRGHTLFSALVRQVFTNLLGTNKLKCAHWTLELKESLEPVSESEPSPSVGLTWGARVSVPVYGTVRPPSASRAENRGEKHGLFYQEWPSRRTGS